MAAIFDPEKEARLIPDDHYAAIGKAADAWASLEFEIDLMVWELMGVKQPIGACVTAHMLSVLPKLKALRALVKLFGLDESDKMLGTFTGEVSNYIDKRNRLIHDRRFVKASTNEVVRYEISAKKELVMEAIPETKNQLEDFQLKTIALMIDFETLCDKIRFELLSSKDEHRELPRGISKLRPDKGKNQSTRT